MEEIYLSNEEIKNLIEMEKKLTSPLKIIFIPWRIVGVIGMISCLYSMVTEAINLDGAIDRITYVLSMVIGLVIIGLFFFGIPYLIDKSLKKKVKVLEDRKHKAYLAKTIDKRESITRGNEGKRKTRYYITINSEEGPIEFDTSYLTYSKTIIGEDVVIVDFGYGVKNVEVYNRKMLRS